MNASKKMKFYNKIYNVNVDTDEQRLNSILTKLNHENNRIPKTKCIKCPGKECVESDCCKDFNPPMYFTEFLNIIKYLEKRESDIVKLRNKCIDRMANPKDNSCSLLKEDGNCLCYEVRPYNCRMFGICSGTEWEKRLEAVRKMDENKEIKFEKQCDGVKIVNKKSEPKKIINDKISNDIFNNIAKLDEEYFSKIYNSKFVNSGITYLSFESHFLIITIGPENLEKILSNKEAFEKNEITKEEFDQFVFSLKD